MKTIADKAVIARLRCSKWEGHKYDRVLSLKVVRDANADEGTARVNKLIVPKTFIEPITKAFGRLYMWHREVTLPWLDTGERILTAAMFFDYREGFRQRQSEAMAQVNAAEQVYPSVLHSAARRLGSMYNANDFPSPSDFASLFSIDVAFLKIPTDDIRAEGLSEEELAEINEAKDMEVQRALRSATQEIWQRLFDAVQRMSERLHAYVPPKGKGDKAQGIFRDSLVENLRGLVDILPKLNFTDDGDIKRMTNELSRKLCAYDADALRESDTTRKTVAMDADAILAKMRQYVA